MGVRIRARADQLGLKAADICRLAEIKPQTMSGYWAGSRPVPSEKLFAIADALRCSARWLVAGVEDNSTLRAVDDADWMEIEEFDLRGMTDQELGPVISTTPIRRDWLYRTFGRSSGIWITRLPNDLPKLDLREGDQVFARNVEQGEAQRGGLYIIRVWELIAAVRIDLLRSTQMNSIEQNLEEHTLAPRDIGTEDGKAVPIARILGAPLRRL